MRHKGGFGEGGAKLRSRHETGKGSPVGGERLGEAHITRTREIRQRTQIVGHSKEVQG